jgi:cell division protease FtsH
LVNSTVKQVVFWLVILLSGILLWSVVKNNNTGAKEREVNFSQFLAEVDQGKIKDVTVYGPEVRGDYKDERLPSTPLSRPTTPTCTSRCATRA